MNSKLLHWRYEKGIIKNPKHKTEMKNKEKGRTDEKSWIKFEKPISHDLK